MLLRDDDGDHDSLALMDAAEASALQLRVEPRGIRLEDRRGELHDVPFDPVAGLPQVWRRRENPLVRHRRNLGDDATERPLARLRITDDGQSAGREPVGQLPCAIEEDRRTHFGREVRCHRFRLLGLDLTRPRRASPPRGQDLRKLFLQECSERLLHIARVCSPSDETEILKERILVVVKGEGRRPHFRAKVRVQVTEVRLEPVFVAVEVDHDADRHHVVRDVRRVDFVARAA
jgi:hypothetical protein